MNDNLREHLLADAAAHFPVKPRFETNPADLAAARAAITATLRMRRSLCRGVHVSARFDTEIETN